MTLLCVEALTLSVPAQSGRHLAVMDLNLEVDRAQTLALVGESGSGKSLSALALMDLLPTGVRQEKGSIHFDGRELSALPARRRRALLGSEIAMVFQDPLSSLNPFLSVGDQVLEAVRRGELRGRAARAEVVRLFEEVEIEDAAQSVLRYPHELSGGQRQRVMIAMALAGDPKLLIADEPTTALDVSVQDRILTLFAKIQAERGLALLLITHDFGVVSRMGGDAAVLYSGRLAERAPTQQLLRAARHPYTRALLSAVPRLSGPKELVAIPGLPPAPGHDLSGCLFAPRCRSVSTRCEEDLPPWVPFEQGGAACFHLDAESEGSPQ